MKCTDEEYRCRDLDTKNVDIHKLIIKDKENYYDEVKMLSCLRILFSSLVKFVSNRDNIVCEYVKLDDSLDIVISFLKQYDVDMYYRFMNVLSNKQIHFISYNDLPEIISFIIDYIYSFVKDINLSITSCEVLDQISDIIYDNLLDSGIDSYLAFLNLDISEIIANCISTDDYNFLKECYINSIVEHDVSSYANDNEVFVCYNNTIKDAFDILHEFIHFDNLCPLNVTHYNEIRCIGDYYVTRPYNFFLNEIPSIMMEGELFDYLASNYSYNLSFYLPYRLGLLEGEINGMFLPIMNADNDYGIKIANEYLDYVRFLLNTSENFSLMYMFMYEYDNFDNRHLSYILGIIVSMYTMTLSKEDRVNIFNYIRSRITSDDNYFMLFKSIGLDILNSKDLSKLVSSLYDRYDTMNKCLVKKK